MRGNDQAKIKGFTLLEVMIALFIYTLLSLMLMSGLRTVINACSGTEEKAERLRDLQRGLLIISRDIEQIINRPVILATGKEECSLKGSLKGFNFTHLGVGDPTGALLRSNMQRTQYVYHDQTLWRSVFPVLDQAPNSQAQQRALLQNLTAVKFQYLDKENHFHAEWPPEDDQQEPLPRAIKMQLTILNWGQLSQLYVISAQPKPIQSTTEKH